MPSKKLRLALNLLDQAIASLLTIGILISAAGSLSSDSFGRFAVGVATIQPAVSIVRAMTGETLLVAVTATGGLLGKRLRNRQLLSGALGGTVLMSIAAALIVCGIALIWKDMAQVLLVSAVAVIPIIFQDSLRHVLLSERQSYRLLLADFAVLVLVIGGNYALGAIGASEDWLLGWWGASCAVVALVVISSARLSIGMNRCWKWIRDSWHTSSSFAFESIVGAAMGYSTVVVLAHFAGPVEVAAYRSCVSVFGLTSLVINFLRTSVLREITPSHVSTVSGVRRLVLRLSPLILVAVGVAFVGVILLPDAWGKRLFSETWPLIVALAIPAAFNRLGAGLSIIPLISLRIQGISWRATRVRLVCQVAAIPIIPLLAYLYGAAGALLAETVLYGAVTTALLALSMRIAKSRVHGALVHEEGN